MNIAAVLLMFIISMGGTFVSALCAIGGVILIFYLAFVYGPKLTLFAVPVAIIFFVVTETDIMRLLGMFDVYMWTPLLVLLVIDAVLLFVRGLVTGSYNFGNLPLHGFFFGIGLLIILGAWTTMPKELPDLEGTEYIEIQEIHSTVQVQTTDHEVFDEWLEDYANAELVGGFEEDLEFNNPNTIYRFTCMDENRELIAEFHFISQRHVMMEYLGRIIVYEAPDPGQMPNDEIIEFHDRVLGY